MIKTGLVFVFMFFFLTTVSGQTIQKDRWLEVDLYWFERNDMKGSSDRFWERISPLFADVAGEKGVILNIGWLMDFILEWDGQLDSPIPFPQNMTIEEQFNDEGYLLGNTEQRLTLWKERFDKARNREIVAYEPWTYSDLKRFATLFRQSAAEHGVSDIRVGTFVLGWQNIYHGNNSRFAAKHPDAFSSTQKFNPTCILKKDRNRYGAFPDGIPDGTPITAFFGKQWGDLSKKTGLDVIVLRDSGLGQGVYARTGPFGRTAPADPSEVRKWCDATASLVRHTKQANPKSLVIGYSNGGTAVGDWRVNCFDLEAIAKEGFLDAYIDQSWAGAWNEVGQRPGGFWNSQRLGWTYQLAYILVHAAVLSETPAKHYFLTETFDAWESWNIIGTAREKLRWGIWAYSHAGVKIPQGLKFPDGSYISWANQVKRLLSEEEVDFLARETNCAMRDLNNIHNINGPTLVYNRSALEWQNNHQPAIQMKEWIDDQVGSLMKFGVPVLSVARIENIDKIESDLWIIQTPIHLKAAEKQAINNVIASRKPMLLCGSPANGIDPDFQASEEKVTLWDPPELSCYVYADNLFHGISTAELLGDLNPYVETARHINEELEQANCLNTWFDDITMPVWYGSWTTRTGKLCVLMASLEEGLDHAGKHVAGIELHLPTGYEHRTMLKELWSGNRYLLSQNPFRYALNKNESRLFEFENVQK
jgi:hypothetical protein